MAGAAAQGRSVCVLAFARETLRAGGEPTPAAVVAAAAASPIGGDFAFAYAVGDGRRIRITVTGNSGTPLSSVSPQVYWALP